MLGWPDRYAYNLRPMRTARTGATAGKTPQSCDVLFGRWRSKHPGDAARRIPCENPRCAEVSTYQSRYRSRRITACRSWTIICRKGILVPVTLNRQTLCLASCAVIIAVMLSGYPALAQQPRANSNVPTASITGTFTVVMQAQ